MISIFVWGEKDEISKEQKNREKSMFLVDMWINEKKLD